MNKLMLSVLLGLFLSITSLSANQMKCDMNSEHHKSMMKKHCDINKMDKSYDCKNTEKCSIEKKSKCDCKKGGECNCKGNCKCDISKKDEKAERCGCGMTKEACKKMMPYCEFRDGKKEKM